MQNEPNFGKAQMNVNKVLTKDYENKPNWTLGENEPKTNPIKANLQNDQMNVNKVLTKDYENKLNWALYENEPNSNPIQTQTNPISKAKKSCSPLLCCGISKEKMISCNLINRKFQLNIIAGRMSNNKTI